MSRSWTVTFEDGSAYEVPHTTNALEAINHAVLNQKSNTARNVVKVESRPSRPSDEFRTGPVLKG